MTAETIRLSIADAASRLGISTDTVRRKLKRGQLQGQRDNHGQWWIAVAADAKPHLPMQHAAYEPKPDAGAVLIEELRGQIERLRSDLDAAYARETAERERHAGEVSRLASDRDHWITMAETSQRQLVALSEKLATETRRSWWPWRRSA